MKRALRKTPQFLAQAYEAIQSVPQLVQAIAGAEWTLVHDPGLGMAVRGTRYKSWPLHPAEGVTFKVIYSFDSKEVVFDGIYPAVPPSAR